MDRGDWMRCPICEKEGAHWIGGKYYRCPHCGSLFTDEDVEHAKRYYPSYTLKDL